MTTTPVDWTPATAPGFPPTEPPPAEPVPIAGGPQDDPSYLVAVEWWALHHEVADRIHAESVRALLVRQVPALVLTLDLLAAERLQPQPEA